ncbi:TMEM165/GDT1 family protein [Streptomyces rubellomurinus]|uniref:GDT1 family protein n=2 Tax=Streptomyces TaxID=1883 RepID=A0A0F2T8K4_STRR3|nr:TMEM165/GDT1 family protein [Streptomyces rubellomurinus]KJS57251.1 membrane protein [Streptomyces rubellomurinus subsp. indigoferus]KJS58062.1 membrane protein [Streptomyces rubellomurinus]
MMSLSIAALTFGVIFLAELPDKTALASLVLGTKYRASYVFAGVAAAFLVQVVIALAAGHLLSMLPHRWVSGVTGALFLIGAAMLLFHGGGDDEDGHAAKEPSSNSFWKVSGASFVVVAIAEFGDLTQIMTANLAAKYTDLLAVGLGSWLGLCAVGGIAIVGGQKLLKVVPMKWIVRVAAAIMIVLAGVSIVGAITG